MGKYFFNIRRYVTKASLAQHVVGESHVIQV